ncbi:hypothetical protein [Maridesulfovibrio sp.]|uniref:hypothetical protein n=1 Tax=Maridesulfovibrio sp. TaxID=2795000 RepID=UPI002A187864|nr:hypothetical protein [Maridesulfovibrio sp.]
MIRMILLAAVLVVLGGCSSWHNPNIVDQDEAKKILARDTDFCNRMTGQQVPIKAETDDAPPEPTTYEAEFSEDYASAVTFDQCMQKRGWVKD